MTYPGIVPGPLIVSPEPLRRRYGLLTAANGPIDLPPHGEGGGVRFQSLTCGVAHPYRIGCYQGEPIAPEDGKPRDANDDEVEAAAFGLVATIECSTVGHTAAEDASRVRRRLDTGEQGGLEQAFWTGLDFEGESLGIEALSTSPDEVAVDPDADTIMGVVSALEDYAYRLQGYGYTAYIHAPVSVAAYAAAENLIVMEGDPQRGGRMVTPYGSVWVFGGGYPGTGTNGAAPPAGGAYLHITGQVTVWRAAEPFVAPVDQTTDKANNVRLLMAERGFAVAFDCFNGRAAFDPLGSS